MKNTPTTDPLGDPRGRAHRPRDPAVRAHARLTRALATRITASRCFALRSVGTLCRSETIVGAGLLRHGRRRCGPGSRRLRLYLRAAVCEATARAILVHDLGIDEGGDPDLPVDRVVTGDVTALRMARRLRPAPGGVSIGHLRGSTGTLGCLARGRGRVRSNRTLILGNQHVLAGPGAAFGDPNLQPGPEDGGRMPEGRIAVLERHVPLDFDGGANRVDCATGWADPEVVQPDVLLEGREARRTVRLCSQPVAARPGMRVVKSGRATGTTRGTVEVCTASIVVRYGNRSALFEDQLEIRGLEGPFSAPGDSGALVWTGEPSRRPVGLVFAGGRQVAFANKISSVLDALDLQLWTGR